MSAIIQKKNQDQKSKSKMIHNTIKAILLSGLLFLLLSNSTGVPQAVSKAPGEANHNSCRTCHSPGNNYNPEIQLILLNADSNAVSHYIPGQVYTARVTVSGDNSPRGFGFQMTCLDSITLSDQGVWSNFGARVRQINLNPLGNSRRYVTQSATSPSGIFTMRWTAPQQDAGPVTFYYTGLAVNLNRTTTGDDNVFDSRTIYPIMSSSQDNIEKPQISFSPNPASDQIIIKGLEGHNRVMIISASGSVYTHQLHEDGVIDISSLESGFYFLRIVDTHSKTKYNQGFIKI